MTRGWVFVFYSYSSASRNARNATTVCDLHCEHILVSYMSVLVAGRQNLDYGRAVKISLDIDPRKVMNRKTRPARRWINALLAQPHFSPL